MRKKIMQIKIAEAIFKREYNRIIDALGGIGHHLVDQYELQRLGHPYYNSRAAGGEGHLEVAKNIYYSHKGLAHMVLALKPFGCMPSTQSDGAQSAVMSHYKDMIFLPVETSGEGDVNAHSRVQMALGEAKAKTKLEFKAALDATGRTLEEIRAYVDEHPGTEVAHVQGPHDRRRDRRGRQLRPARGRTHEGGRPHSQPRRRSSKRAASACLEDRQTSGDTEWVAQAEAAEPEQAIAAKHGGAFVPLGNLSKPLIAPPPPVVKPVTSARRRKARR